MDLFVMSKSSLYVPLPLKASFDSTARKIVNSWPSTIDDVYDELNKGSDKVIRYVLGF